MNKLLILCLVLLLVILVLLFSIIQMYNYQNKIKNMVSYYINVYKREKNMKQIMCESNKDCSNKQVCQMDIDHQKRCFDKENIIKNVCTKLVLPKWMSNPKFKGIDPCEHYCPCSNRNNNK